MRSDVDGVAEEHEGRCRRVAGDPSTSEPLVAVNAEERERELHLVPSPHSLPNSLRLSESTQHRSHAHHVETLVAAQGHHHRAHRRRGDVAEAEMLPERVVVAREAAPQTTHARRHTQRGSVESFQDFPKNVYVVVYEELRPFLSLSPVLLLHHSFQHHSHTKSMNGTEKRREKEIERESEKARKREREREKERDLSS